MSKFLTLSASAILAAVCGASVRAQTATPDEWRPMEFQDLRTPSQTDPLQVIVWPDVIARENDYVLKQLKRPLDGKNAFVTAITSSYRIADKTIIVSLVLVRDCDSGPNDKNANIVPSICPLRIVVMRAGKVVTTKTSAGCYIDHSEAGLPEKNRSDEVYTRLKKDRGAIEIKVNVGGQEVAECARSVEIN